MTSDAGTADDTTAEGPMPVWRDLTTPDGVVDALFGLYRHRGQARYDEAVSQLEHALQAASLALASGAGDAVIVAALFHDIGHLLTGRVDGRAGPGWDLHHEDVGARFLARWFDDDVTRPIRLHVGAKRALCASEPAYRRGLSPASEASLVLQGGPFDPVELLDFLDDPHGPDALDLRRWDDRAKSPGAPVPDLDAFRSVVLAVASRP